jgi:uncharacterized protein YceK
MVKPISRVILGTALLLAMSGCGTVCNLVWFNESEGGGRVYGGVRTSAQVIYDTANQALCGAGDEKVHPHSARTACILLLDLPLTVVGDTATLPITATWTAVRYWYPENPTQRSNEGDPLTPSGESR